MATIKHTKNELKAQREALARFERYLPMLQLKKQQLQAEIQATEAAIAEREALDRDLRASMAPWRKLFSEKEDGEPIVRLTAVRTDTGNIAGVAVPVLAGVDMERADIDLFLSPPWMDDAAAALEQLIRIRVERDVLAEQRDRIADELRVTSQRVNLFEKVKIPECKENIRIIKIFLGDEQTAAVARGKLAKKKTQAFEYDDVTIEAAI